MITECGHEYNAGKFLIQGTLECNDSTPACITITGQADNDKIIFEGEDSKNTQIITSTYVCVAFLVNSSLVHITVNNIAITGEVIHRSEISIIDVNFNFYGVNMNEGTITTFSGWNLTVNHCSFNKSFILYGDSIAIFNSIFSMMTKYKLFLL